MSDKSWMLHPQAIRYAYDCIHLIKDLEGIRLKLSQPDFIQQVHERVEQLQSPELGECYANLIAMAGVGTVIRELKPVDQKLEEVEAPPKAVGADYHDADDGETIEFNGNVYSRFRNGGEFKGLYRGMPRYA